jgi:DNA-binding PadR family transcriptional regulator
MFAPGSFHGFPRAREHSGIMERGFIKLLILDLLHDRPAHGYDIIRSLEEMFNGFYSPSAGSIYPTLQALEEASYVTSTETEGKKVYTISDRGKKYVASHKEPITHIKERISAFSGLTDRREAAETFGEMRRLMRTVMQKARDLDASQWTGIRDVLRSASRDIEDISAGRRA